MEFLLYRYLLPQYIDVYCYKCQTLLQRRVILCSVLPKHCETKTHETDSKDNKTVLPTFDTWFHHTIVKLAITKFSSI